MIFLLMCVQFDIQAELDALKQAPPVRAQWSVTASATSGPELIVVSTSPCIPCLQLKEMLDRLGYQYRPLTESECQAELGFRPSSFPYSLIKTDKNYVWNGRPTEAQLVSWLTKHGIQKAVASDAICTVDAEPTLESIVSAIATHTMKEKPVGGLLDIEAPVSPDMREILRAIAYSKELELGRVKLTWEKISVDVASGRVLMKEPINVAGRAAGFTVRVQIKALRLSRDAKTIDVEIDNFPDLKVVFTCPNE